jgi:hypothetical protein
MLNTDRKFSVDARARMILKLREPSLILERRLRPQSDTVFVPLDLEDDATMLSDGIKGCALPIEDDILPKSRM